MQDKEEEALIQDDRRISDFEVSPDGQAIAFTSRFENRRNQGNLSEIFLLDLSDKSIKQLTDNKAPEGNLQWIPKSNRLSFTAPDIHDWELRNNFV